MRQNILIRKLFQPLKRTPFHPQWFVFKDEQKALKEIGMLAKGIVLDIGAGKQEVRTVLNKGTKYISLDYYQTAKEWYGTRPCIFADGQQLPFCDESVDTVLLLDVLEHLPRPNDCLKEIQRVLKPGGIFLMQVPFLYPLHDVPYDFHRWTIHGLRSFAAQYGFAKQEVEYSGHPLETSVLLMNLAISHTILDWWQQKNLLLIFTPLFLLFLPSSNAIAWLLAKMSMHDGFMPHSYRMVWTKMECLNQKKLEG